MPLMDLNDVPINNTLNFIAQNKKRERERERERERGGEDC